VRCRAAGSGKPSALGEKGVEPLALGSLRLWVRKLSSHWLWGGKPAGFRMEGYRVCEFGKPIALCGEQVVLKGVDRQDLGRWEL